MDMRLDSLLSRSRISAVLPLRSQGPLLQLRDYNDLLIEGEGEGEGEGRITINAVAILGLEKHLSPELTAEYSDRRVALQRAVLSEHRQHRAMRIPHSTSTAKLAMVSAQHSQWARERARAAALFLQQDVMQDFKHMNLRVTGDGASSLFDASSE
eukprot:scaffold7779_cov107-Skeletonema_menzelii.AAC.2